MLGTVVAMYGGLFGGLVVIGTGYSCLALLPAFIDDWKDDSGG